VRVLREAVLGIRRAPALTVLSVMAIGLSVFSIGLFALTAHNIDVALSDVERRVEVVAYLRDDASEELIEIARHEIESFPEVESARYISKVEALYEASRELTEFSDVYSDLEVNPLPASLEIALRPDHHTPDDVEAVADRVSSYHFVEEARYGREWVDRIYSLRRVAGGAAVILGLSFAIGASLLIGIAVRMSVLARANEIAIMRTVGATDAYIRRPFLVEGLATGIGGGLLALALTWSTYQAVERTLLSLSWLPDLWTASGLALAGILGMLAAGRAVRRELRRLDVY
jgi:cell division transport system permease protein